MWSFRSLIYISAYVCLFGRLRQHSILSVYLHSGVCVCVSSHHWSQRPRAPVNLIITGKSLNSKPDNLIIQSTEGDSPFWGGTGAQRRRHYWSIIGFFSIKTTMQQINNCSEMWPMLLYIISVVAAVDQCAWLWCASSGLRSGGGGAAKTELSQWHQALSAHSSLTPTHPVLTCRGEEMIKTGCFIACTLTHTLWHIVRHADANKYTYVDAASRSLGRQTAPHQILLNRGQQTYSFLLSN